MIIATRLPIRSVSFSLRPLPPSTAAVFLTALLLLLGGWANPPTLRAIDGNEHGPRLSSVDGLYDVAFSAAFAPQITATKTAALVNDDGDGLADPGETIRYTVTITNSGDMDALDVGFDDTVDQNTTLVPGSVMTTPVALDDSYDALGNVGVTTPVAGGVLGNDVPTAWGRPLP